MSDWHFLRPLWFIALPLGLAALWWLQRRERSAGRWRSVVDEALQPYVLTGGKDATSRWLSVVQMLIFSLLIVALAGPVGERLPQPVYRDSTALVIALDLSQSMNAQDVLPTRLERARLKVRDLLAERRQGDTALVVFAGDAFTVTPLTDDVATIEAMLESLSTRTMPRQGSLVAPALARAARLLNDAGAQEGRVLLIADGVADRAEAVAAAGELAQQGVVVSVLGVGTPEGDVVRNAAGELIKDGAGQIVVARTDVAALASVSAAGNGRFTMLTADDSDIAGLTGDVERSIAQGILSEDFETDVWRELGPWLVLVCLPLIALLFRRGLIVAFAAVAFMPVPKAHAGVWTDLWANDNQQAAQRFEQEDFAGAAQQFDDPNWAAAAAFRAGDYARSAELLDGMEQPDALYNRGNALAFAGDIDGARDAYKKALDLQPDHEDAQHNLDILDQLPPQQNNQGDQAEQQDGDSQEGDSGEQGQSGSSGQTGDSGDSSDQSDGHGQDSGPEGQAGSEGDQAGESEADGDASQQDEELGEGQDGESPSDEQDQREGQEGQARQASNDAQTERDLAAEQWLRQVPDDPGGLLRRKFEQQYRLRYEGRPEESQPW